MSDATCETCPWCDESKGDGGKDDYGYCRKLPPGYSGKFMLVVRGYDWCGSHPDRQPLLECATTTLVGRETFPTESDMRRIVDALERMANRTKLGVP